MMMLYSYDRRFAKESPEELKKSLDMYRQMLEIMERAAPSLESYIAVKSTFEGAYNQVAPLVRLLFLGLITSYQMNSKDRKVIETATKAFSKRRIVIRRGNYTEALAQLLSDWRTYYNVAKRVLESGEQHTEETTWKAGPFNLVNTGGFPEKTMQEAVKVVTKSAQLMKQKGFSKVCYGDLLVTNTIQRSTRVLAFYQVNSDELFIRANLKGKASPAIRSVCHELAHRLYYKFLKSKKEEILQIYKILGKQESARVEALLWDKSRWPSPGDTYKEGKRTFIVQGIEYPHVLLSLKDGDPHRKFQAPLKSFIVNQSTDSTSAFVSLYAAKTPDENFAEMVAFYALDQLPDDQVNMLKGIL